MFVLIIVGLAVLYPEGSGDCQLGDFPAWNSDIDRKKITTLLVKKIALQWCAIFDDASQSGSRRNRWNQVMAHRRKPSAAPELSTISLVFF
jgi:hypothetical protein